MRLIGKGRLKMRVVFILSLSYILAMQVISQISPALAH